jgi:hypothetical protein
MSFALRDRWYCTFMEEDLRSPAAPGRTFTSADNMVEMIRRGNGFRDLASRQAVEHAIQSGRGNVDLLLTDDQYNTLTITPNGITSSTGLAVPFERDSKGRITKITYP